MTYTLYRAPGWHGEPRDPVIGETDDERYAAMRAGERVDIRMPGGSNPHDCYAIDPEGDIVDPIESYRCDGCGELIEWDDDGPTGALDGEILPEPGAYESHAIDWVCESCSLDLCWSPVAACDCGRCEESQT